MNNFSFDENRALNPDFYELQITSEMEINNNLSIKRGELGALMGPSGCGKSTLLNIIGGLLKGDSGSIAFNSETIQHNYGTKNPSHVVDVRRYGVGWIFQDFHLLNQLTAIDNVALALEITGVSKEKAEKEARKTLIKS